MGSNQVNWRLGTCLLGTKNCICKLLPYQHRQLRNFGCPSGSGATNSVTNPRIVGMRMMIEELNLRSGPPVTGQTGAGDTTDTNVNSINTCARHYSCNDSG
jgi:hypothetical protein